MLGIGFWVIVFYMLLGLFLGFGVVFGCDGVYDWFMRLCDGNEVVV